MIYRLFCIILFAVFSLSATGQTIRITIQDRNNSETVPFAYINTLSTTGTVVNTVQSNENGVANLVVENYPVTIEINVLGYEPLKRTFMRAPAGNTLTLYMVKEFSTMNEVVITGLNTPTRQKDALSVYKVITKEQIQAQGAVTLDEVMKNQLNTRVSNDNILGASMDMQGLNGDKVKILIDGLPVNGRENGNINLSQINLYNIDRIEIIQGPMSVVYGSDALGGIINLITKKEKKPFSVSAGTLYESYGRYNFDASASKSIGKRHQVTLGGGRNSFTGWNEVETIRTYNGDTLLNTRGYLFKPNTQYLANAAYNYRAASGFNLNFASDFVDESVVDKGSLRNWDPYLGADAIDEYFHTTRSMNRLSMNGKLGTKGTWQSQNGYMIYHRTRTSYVKDMVTLEQELNSSQGSQDTSTFRDVYARGSYSNNIGRLGYTLGYDINLQYAFSMKIAGLDKSIQDYAAYANLSYDIINGKLKAQAGMRGAYNTVYDPPVIPTVNLLYTPIEKLQIRASYAEGYRAPSLKELYLSFIDINHYIIGNENLGAESSRHAQLSASYQAYEKDNDYLQVILTGFYNDVYDGITLAPIDPTDSLSIEYTYANLSHQTNIISNLQVDGQLSNLHYIIGFSHSYTYADSNNKKFAFPSSEATASFQYSWRNPGLNFNLVYKLNGKRPMLSAGLDGTARYTGTQEPFHLCDVSVGKKFFSRKLQVIAGVKNVFDFQQASFTGAAQSSGGGHGAASTTTGIISNLPRSFFTSLRLNIN